MTQINVTSENKFPCEYLKLWYVCLLNIGRVGAIMSSGARCWRLRVSLCDPGARHSSESGDSRASRAKVERLFPFFYVFLF